MLFQVHGLDAYRQHARNEEPLHHGEKKGSLTRRRVTSGSTVGTERTRMRAKKGCLAGMLLGQ